MPAGNDDEGISDNRDPGLTAESGAATHRAGDTHAADTAAQHTPVDIQAWVARLVNAVEVGDLLDLAPGIPDEKVCPADSATWTADRVIPVSALRAVLSNAALRVDPRGLHIRAGRFSEHLDLQNVDFPHHLQLTCCSLAAGLNADSTRFRQLSLASTHVAGEVRAADATITGSLTLSGARLSNSGGTALNLDRAKIGGDFDGGSMHVTGGVTARDATITGCLYLFGSELTNPDETALDLQRAKISADFYAQNLVVEGDVCAEDTTITGSLTLWGARLSAQLELNRAKIGGHLLGPFIHVGGGFSLADATLAGLFLPNAHLRAVVDAALNLYCARIGGVSAPGLIAEGEVCAVRATIDGDLSLPGGKITADVGYAFTLDLATISGDLIATALEVGGGVSAARASIGGRFDISEAQVGCTDGPALWLFGATMRNLSGRGLSVHGPMLAVEASIGGEVDLTEAQLDSPTDEPALSLRDARVGALVLRPDAFDGLLDFSGATIGSLRTTAEPPVPLEAVGWEVGNVQGPLRDWRVAHQWLTRSISSPNKPDADDTAAPTVAVQPWRSLAAAYERLGDPASAKRLRVAAAHQVTRLSSWPTKAARWMYFLFAGYGYYPLLALLWTLAVTVVTVGIVAANRHDIVPTDPAKAQTAVERHFGIGPATAGPERAEKQAQADAFLPVTAATPCAVHRDYPCMNSWTFAINAVLPQAASTNRDWDIAADASPALTAILPALKLLSWALAAVLLTGVTGLLRQD